MKEGKPPHSFYINGKLKSYKRNLGNLFDLA